MSLFDRIEVYIVFNGEGRKMRPVKFRWNGRVYAVRDVTYTWESTRGATKYLHFAVCDDANLFELVFDSSALVWEVRNVENLSEMPDEWNVRRQT
jgi:hypothetical protein